MTRNAYVVAAGLGMAAGMRSMSAPAFVSDRYAQSPSVRLAVSPLWWLVSPKAASVTKMLALGEVLVDKLPFVGARIEPGPLAARGVSGGLAGATVCVAEGRNAAIGAGVGLLAALASAFAFYHLRRSLGEKIGVPDPLLALAEDALVLSIGRTALGGESS